MTENLDVAAGSLAITESISFNNFLKIIIFKILTIHLNIII